MAAALPTADIHALTLNPSAGLHFGDRRVDTTFLNHRRLRNRNRALQLPLMPLAWRYASSDTYDVVVTSSHACAKGFRPGRKALHLSYCYTPMRYVWLASLDQRRDRNVINSIGERYLKAWDLHSVGWVDEFAAISTTVQDRIRQFYARDAQVVHPPVDTHRFTPAVSVERGGFALAVSRMVPYKRLDLAIRSVHRVGYPLVVAGAGPEEHRLRALAGELGADVRFVIEPTDEDLTTLYRRANVVVFAAEEDFGIVPVEAQACGTPVVAYGRGGAVDTVRPGLTGVLVDSQDEEGLASGVETVLNGHFDPLACRRNAERFSPERFRDAFLTWVTASAQARGIELGDPHIARW